MKLIIDIDENDYHRFINGFANEDDAILIEHILRVAIPFENLSKFNIYRVNNLCAYTRPQGEWIFHKDFNESCRYGCNQCGNLTNIPNNFCPNCGVKMQKGGAK